MRIIAALMEPSGGELLYRGRPLSAVGPGFRREIGILFQDPDSSFIGETVKEDVRFGPRNFGASRKEQEEAAAAALERFGLSAAGDLSPHVLSGGEKRRLAAAGLAAAGAEVWILDEPFANLDWPSVVEMLRFIMELRAAGKTLLILTHELEKVLAHADRLLILDRGILRADGKPVEVLDRLEDAWGVRDPRQSYLTVEDCTWAR
jgi:biotin transport system ATP-binding protein